jgi:hypothetical protein
MTDPPVSPDDDPPALAAAPADVVRTDAVDGAAASPTAAHPQRMLKLLSIAVIVAGGILAVSGVTTWIVVQAQLSDEKITVSDDADRFAGDRVDGPLTAYAEADAIERHALEASGGLTYAELPRDDPTRETVMTASFLRASLFTSVVSFGVAVMAFGLGVIFILVGIALLKLTSQLTALPRAATT